MSDQEQPGRSFKGRKGMLHVMAAIAYSFAGLKAAWNNESAFRQEVLVAIPAAIVAMLLPVTPLEKLVLLAVLILVLIVEIINSAIEAVVDRVSLERHPLSKNAKDMGSAAVCLSIVLAGLAWAVIVLPLLLG